MTYAVIQPDNTTLEDVLTGLWNSNLKIQGDPREKYRWKYLDSPAGQGAALLLQCADRAGNTSIVGCAGIGSRTLYHGDTTLRAGLLMDLAVDKAHRTLLPALMLQRAMRTYIRGKFDLAYGFPGPSTIGIFLRAGYREIGKIHRYVRILRYEPYLSRLRSQVPVTRVAGNLLGQLARFSHSLLTLRAPDSLQIEWLQGVDSRFDRLWQDGYRTYPVIGLRGAGFLRWRFLDRQTHRSDVAALVDKASGRVSAYAVVRSRGGIAHIVDFLAVSETTLGIFLNLLASVLRRRGFMSMSIGLLGPKRLKKLLETHGFYLREATHAVVIDPGDRLPCDPAILFDPENWYITGADADT